MDEEFEHTQHMRSRYGDQGAYEYCFLLFNLLCGSGFVPGGVLSVVSSAHDGRGAARRDSPRPRPSAAASLVLLPYGSTEDSRIVRPRRARARGRFVRPAHLEPSTHIASFYSCALTSARARLPRVGLQVRGGILPGDALGRACDAARVWPRCRVPGPHPPLNLAHL